MRACGLVSCLLALGLCLSAGPDAAADVLVLTDIPSYGQNPDGFSGYPTGFPGCAPTAAGMVLGYWDANGYGNLITGSNSWADNRANVEAMIGSQDHYDDYWGTDAAGPYHANDCVADFMGTSRDPKGDGQTSEANVYLGMVDYAKSRGYAYANGWYALHGGLWDVFVAQIDAGRPMVFAVDTNGDSEVNHCVTAIGYDDAEGAERYYYWDPNRVDTQCSAPFRPVGDVMGVSSGHWFNPVPEPATIALLALGLGWLGARRRSQRAGNDMA